MKDGVKAFVVYKNKILWILRDNNPNIPWPNTWNLPGGGVEGEETNEEALKRELQEEINLCPRNIVYLGKHNYPEGRYSARYLVRLTKGEYKRLELLCEGQVMEFFTIEEKLKLPTTPKMKKYLIKNKKVLEAVIIENKSINSESLGLEP